MTMPQSLFWVEPTEIAQAIDRLRTGRPGSKSVSSAVRAPVLPARPNRPPAPPERMPDAALDAPTADAPLEQRLGALLAWAEAISEAQHVFVVDQDGLAVVHDSSAPLELIAASGSLAETWEALRHRFGWSQTHRLATELSDDQWLHLSGVTTAWGFFSLGLVVPTPLPKTTLVRIHQRFEATLIEKEQPADAT